ncbi:MAG: sigma-70 family RNA polymerase sigma factor [Bacteroidia bacterium]|nr:sigma-70 family RNA polymerase sigma factor [Bacteroidia bacterium]
MVKDQLIETFRSEYGNLVAVLCHFHGIQNIQLAEDIVSDTFLHAMKVWSHKGVPDSPKAWLRKVAVNKFRDYYRRRQTFREKVKGNYFQSLQQTNEIILTEEIISDGLLNMIFAICNSNLKIDIQICLSLRLLCGFGIGQIAAALLTNKENINKKLYRGKKQLRKYKDSWNQLSRNDYASRIPSVLRIIYLLFNEGYYSSVSDENIKQDFCWEAMRLAIFMSKQSFLPKKDTYALIALMCFHASRLDSRTNPNGQYILYQEQDRNKWNNNLIKKGEYYLTKSANGNNVSKYHLEAAIAYWHTTEVPNKWDNILQLYNRLLLVEYSPIIAMNRTYALAIANSAEEAIIEARKLNLEDNYYYYWLMAELFRLNLEPEMEIEYLNKALDSAKKISEKEILKTKLDKASREQSAKRT